MQLDLLCGPSTYARTNSISTTTPTVPLMEAMTFEVDYDDDDDDNEHGGGGGPTSLYQAIEAQAWIPILQFLETGTWESGWLWSPQSDPQSPSMQAKTWVTRFEPLPTTTTTTTTTTNHNDDESTNSNANSSSSNNHKNNKLRLDSPHRHNDDTTTSMPTPRIIRWSQLPIHAAILFGAPLAVIQALIQIYPPSIRCTDDRHSLPLHLALSVGASDDICAFLAHAFPQALLTRNQKGLLPCQVTSPQRTARQELLQLCLMNAGPIPLDDDVLVYYKGQVKQLKHDKAQLQTMVQSLQDQNQVSLAQQQTLQERVHQLEAELRTAKATTTPLQQQLHLLQHLQRIPPRSQAHSPRVSVEETRDVMESFSSDRMDGGGNGNGATWNYGRKINKYSDRNRTGRTQRQPHDERHRRPSEQAPATIASSSLCVGIGGISDRSLLQAATSHNHRGSSRIHSDRRHQPRSLRGGTARSQRSDKYEHETFHQGGGGR